MCNVTFAHVARLRAGAWCSCSCTRGSPDSAKFSVVAHLCVNHYALTAVARDLLDTTVVRLDTMVHQSPRRGGPGDTAPRATVADMGARQHVTAEC